MAKTVFKYPLQVAFEQTIEMPEGAQILCVQTQNGDPQLWALVDTDHSPNKRTILIVGTGHYADGFGRYISTFQIDEGSLIFHVFEAA